MYSITYTSLSWSWRVFNCSLGLSSRSLYRFHRLPDPHQMPFYVIVTCSDSFCFDFSPPSSLFRFLADTLYISDTKLDIRRRSDVFNNQEIKKKKEEARLDCATGQREAPSWNKRVGGEWTLYADMRWWSKTTWQNQKREEAEVGESKKKEEDAIPNTLSKKWVWMAHADAPVADDGRWWDETNITTWHNRKKKRRKRWKRDKNMADSEGV